MKKAIESGFNAKKIILRNKDVPPSKLYYKMLKQIETFPDEPLTIECEFYGDYSIGSFFEIDLAFKVSKFLFIFECKSYGTPFSENPQFLKWMDNFHRNMHLTIIKGRHIMENLKEKHFDVEFLKGVEKFVPIIIQTEGLFPSYGILEFNMFEKFLKELKQLLEDDTIEDFLKRPSEMEFDIRE